MRVKKIGTYSDSRLIKEYPIIASIEVVDVNSIADVETETLINDVIDENAFARNNLRIITFTNGDKLYDLKSTEFKKSGGMKESDNVTISAGIGWMDRTGINNCLTYVSGTLFGSYTSPSYYTVYADRNCIINESFSTNGFYDLSKSGTEAFSFKLDTSTYAANGNKVTYRVKTHITD